MKKEFTPIELFFVIFAVIALVLGLVGCAASPVKSGFFPQQTIRGTNLIAMLQAVSPDVRGIDPSAEYTLLPEDWVWDTLTGPPLTGNEPFTAEYVSQARAAYTGKPVHVCGHYATATEFFISTRAPDAAFGTLILPAFQDPLIGPFTYGCMKNGEFTGSHAVNWFVTPLLEIRFIDPQAPTRVGWIEDLDHVGLISRF